MYGWLDLEDINVKIIAIEEHWNSVNIRDALDRLPGAARDESVVLNTMGDTRARLEDIGQGRIEAMDAAGIDISILARWSTRGRAPVCWTIPPTTTCSRPRPAWASRSSSTRRSRPTNCAMPPTVASIR